MLEIQHFSYTYRSGVKAVNDVSLRAIPGEFVVVAGPNGSGKSTLLKSILDIPQVYYGGVVEGTITYQGKPVCEQGIVRLASNIGIVLQDPESQISNLTVWEEVTFALGNMLYSRDEIALRASDALRSMDVAGLRDRSVHTLSGGQLQRVSLAALTALRPRILILDEPLANLDPSGIIAVTDLLAKIKKLVDIVIVASHWIDPFLGLSTRLIAMDRGKLVLDIPTGSIEHYVRELESHNIEMPQYLRIKSILHSQGVDAQIIEGRISLPPSAILRPVRAEELPDNTEDAVLLTDVYYHYPNGLTSLRDLHVSIRRGTRVALVGDNGSGKTTLLRLLAGLRKPTAGRISTYASRPAMMLQKPGLSFLTSTVQSEIAYGTKLREAEITSILSRFGLLQHRSRSPFQLSGGEQRLLALALTTVRRFDILILDEPTAGLDAQRVELLKEVIQSYSETVVCATHDSRLMGLVFSDLILLDKGYVSFCGNAAQLNRELLIRLGYPGINPTVALGLEYLDEGVPLSPEQIDAYHNYARAT